jgi:phage-related protein
MPNTVTILINARNRAEAGFASVRQTFANLGSNIRTHLTSSFNHVRSAFSSLGEHFRTIGGRMRSTFSRIGGDLRSGLSRGFSAVGRLGSRVGSTIMTGVRSAITAGMQGIGSAFSSIGESLGRVLSVAGSNPYVAAGIAALVAVLLPIIGTAIGGALVLGIGGALAGVGLMFAAKSKEAQDSFKKTGQVIHSVMSDAAKPLIPVITHAMGLVQKFVKEAGPALKGIFKDMAPHLEKFTDSLFKAFKALAPAMKPLTDAFGMLLDALGPAIVDIFQQISLALMTLGKEFQNKDTIANFVDIFKVLMSTIPIGISLITGLAMVMRGFRVATVMTIEKVKEFIGWVKRIVGKTVHFGQTGITAVINWVKSVISWVKNMKGKTVAFFQRGAGAVVSAVSGVISWVRRMAGKTISLAQRGASGVVGWISSIVSWVRRMAGKTISVGVRGAGAAISAVQGLINRIRNLVGKTVSIGVNFFKNAGGKLASALGFAHGGIVGAASGGARSALTLVGEHGPELVDLAPGTRVHSNEDSRRMVQLGGGSDRPIVIQLQIAGRDAGEYLIDPLRSAVYRRGGNVQAVLGRA